MSTELPVIIATARDQSDIVEAFNLGANDYITKPIDFPTLVTRLQTQLQLRSLSRQKDEFVGIASHDLKNPLSVIRGYASTQAKNSSGLGLAICKQLIELHAGSIGATANPDGGTTTSHQRACDRSG